MVIVIEDAKMERLAQQIAAAEGVTIADILRESLTSLAGLRGLPVQKAPLRERLASLAQEGDAILPRTPADMRSDDAILSYNEFGAW
ncbi:MAG: type II toxin-antitoxin system VapB family antitoxin [Azoarcus sp.]|jgi:hypothetical protein|nr:type II toxin-antitoxin system VapB family antitoxin [Azoarcus sp.]